VISVNFLLIVLGCILLGCQGFSFPRDTGRFQLGWLGLFCFGLTVLLARGI
jgi:hypothetical protein